ncbi:MAG: DDE-type integrase/transposase/recombinase, partial [Candidatus Competibacteraceae bacterium]|nr:DDE-type integrase/transposase/recombinase [Candidatus Competibacteraceae bacterium]
PVFDNHLARRFAVKQINQVYAGDITYTWTGEGWLYLAFVMDLCSRKVVGWRMSSRMTARLVCDALTMAIWQRRPQTGLIHHSDRGSQYRRSREAVCHRQEALTVSRRTYAQQCLHAATEKLRVPRQYALKRTLLGHRGRRKLLWQPQTRVRSLASLPNALSSPAGYFALHHDVL